MSQTALFSSGITLAPFVTSSTLLRKSWDVISCIHDRDGLISDKGVDLSWKVYEELDSNLMIIAFESTLDDSSQLRTDWVTSSALRDNNFHHFDFLCTERFPLFSVNITAISLFRVNHEKLDQLKYKIRSSSTRLIVTGVGFGGSVASLFTISLLDSIWLGKNRPLCITFGSPLIGDKKLQEIISRSPVWKSCFFNVVSYKDSVPKILNPDTMPFGTFLFCSESNSTCFENPQSVLELLVSLITDQNQGFQPIDYGNIVGNLYRKAICKDFTPQGQELIHSDSLRASICLQLWATLGLTPNMQQQQHLNIDINAMVTELEKQQKIFILKKMVKFDPSRKLNMMEISMANLEWYVKDKKNKGIGYYDGYKQFSTLMDKDILMYSRKLTNYWRDVVEEAKLKPQKGNAAFRKRWLYAGTSYRRMVEPLVIAEHYINGGKDYVDKHRPKHFVLLEELLRNEMNKTNPSNEEDICDLDYDLNWDSYWSVVVDTHVFSTQGSNHDQNWDSCTSVVDNHVCSNQGSNYDRNWDSCTSVVDNHIRSNQGSNYDRNWDSCTSIVDNLISSNKGSNYDPNWDSFTGVVDNLIRSQQGSMVDEERKDNSNYDRQGTFRLQDLDEILNSIRKKNMQNILSFDSCFWAYVEEARISCQELQVIQEKEETLKKLVEFEDYVYGLLQNYEVSPDIFLSQSSYMGWWNEYKDIKGTSYDSKLTSFMNNDTNFEQYASGDYDFF